jgi:(p)ppGpp synthase/HD superfamily hydrolase
MPTLEDAISLAVKAHRGRKDKVGAAYILHPLRVMLRMKTKDERIVALLHDVIEDTKYTLEDLREAGYSRKILQSLDYLTKRDGEEYEEFIKRVKRHPLARRVKIADLKDNLDLKRIKKPKKRDLMRIKKYRRALSELMKGYGLPDGR